MAFGVRVGVEGRGGAGRGLRRILVVSVVFGALSLAVITGSWLVEQVLALPRAKRAGG